MKILSGLFGRLWLARGWVVAQFAGTLLLILAGLAWTRLPDKHGWQVALSLLIPVLLAISVLELQAGTVRKLADDDGKRVKFLWGAITLLVWVALLAVSWWVLNWCDDQIPQWAGYLNSRTPAHARVSYFSSEHLSRGMSILEWVLRWIVAPAKLILLGAASAQWGFRLPWRRILRLLFNWRWWLAVVLAALAAVLLPGRFFIAEPTGTVSAQVWRVSMKLAGAYVLAIGSWVLLLGWVATLFARQKPPTEEVLASVLELVGPEEESGGEVEQPSVEG